MNRADKTFTSEIVAEDFNKAEKIFEKTLLIPDQDDASKTQSEHILYEHQGQKTYKLELFKTGIERIYKTIKFAQFE